MTAPLVSILVPAHNAAPWLAATLESALAQTWPRVEIIVVENNSTDDTGAVAQRFASRGVRLVSTTTPGASAARNRALREAQGEVIQYLDGDDLLSPDKIAHQMANLDPAGPVLSLSALCDFADGEDPTAAPVLRGWPFLPSTHPRAWLGDLLGENGRGGFVALHQWLTPRALLERAGPWDENLTVNDDGEFFCRVLLQAREIRTALDGVAYYRRHRSGRSLSSTYRQHGRHLGSMINALDLITAHLAAAEPLSAGLRVALARHYYEIALLAHPLHPALSRTAERQALQLDAGARPPAPTSPLAAAVRRSFGWRAERRLAAWRQKWGSTQ